ncbi:M1 family aminopeptidase [Myxococcaceae bacterium GXIMD 01537]
MASPLRWLPLLLLAGTPAWSAGESPEVQLCLQHLKPAERVKAEKALGPLGELPRYRVQLDVDPKAREVKGRVQLELTARGKPLQEVFLRLTPNAADPQVTLSQAKVNGQPAELEQTDATLTRIKIEPAVPAGGTALVEVALQARVPRASQSAGSLMGMFGGGGAEGAPDYGAFSAAPDFLSLVGVVPLAPPLDGDGKPGAGPTGIGDLALYEPSHVLATITVPSGWAVHATGAPMGEVPERDGRVRFAFAAGAVRDFPVFVSRGYEKATTSSGGVTVESHYAAGDAKAGKRVLEYARSSLAEYERRLGPLPYTHFRVVQAPLSGGAGGMEFPGLVTVATSLYRGATDPGGALGAFQGMGAMQQMLGAMGGQGQGPLAQLGQTLERTLEFTVAHEVAHQYFAGMVGSDPIHSPVVDESLAQYAALLYFEWAHGKPAAESLKREALVAPYHLYRLSGGEDGPADRPTDGFSGPMEYGALVYGKAPLLHAASRKLIGDEAFVRGMRSYVDTYRFKWTCSDCFTRELAKASPGQARALEKLRVRWWQESKGDEDLGQADLSALMGSMGMGTGGMELDVESMKMLEQLLPGLLGQ